MLVPTPPLVALGEPVPALLAAVRRGDGDVALLTPTGALGPADRLAATALKRLTGATLRAPARQPVVFKGEVLPVLVPFASIAAIGLGIAIDAFRAGFRLCEVEGAPATPRGPLVEARALKAVVLTELTRR